MNENAMLTGKPSIDRPWMKFYPEVLRGIQVPACTVEQYLSVRAADPNVRDCHALLWRGYHLGYRVP